MVDYVLTVAVSTSSAAANIGALIPFVNRHNVLFVVGAILLLAAMNLRGGASPERGWRFLSMLSCSACCW